MKAGKFLGLTLAGVTLILSSAVAQINWFEHDIDNSFDGAWGLSVIDMDGDDDLDVVSCAKEDDIIAWYKNDGDLFFEQYVIDSNFEKAKCVKAIDIDGDGDVDVLGAGDGVGSDGIISWWENDGEMNFSPHNITSNFEYSQWADAADIDGDGDIDIVAVATWGDEIAWWENDGEENFTQHSIVTGFRFPYFVSAVDLDNDDDMDLIAGAAYEAVTWFENDGEEVFTQRSISYSDSCFTTSMAVVDMDNDGDLDVLATELWLDRVYWFENDASQNFSMHIIEYNFNGAYSVEAADIDNDGDMDAVGAAWDDDAITWWENNNNNTFSRHDLTTSLSYARRAVPADLDGDGALDIVATGERADRICWWESDLVTGLTDSNDELPTRIALLPAYPNPFNAATRISFNLSSAQQVKLEVYDIQGRIIRTLINGFQQAGTFHVNFDASFLASGTYFYRLQAGDYTETKTMTLAK